MENKTNTGIPIREAILRAIQSAPHNEALQSVSLFGSQANGSAGPESDIDLLVEFKPEERVGLFKFVELRRGLSQALGRSVDLLTSESLSPYFRAEVLASALPIYEV